MGESPPTSVPPPRSIFHTLIHVSLHTFAAPPAALPGQCALFIDTSPPHTTDGFDSLQRKLGA